MFRRRRRRPPVAHLEIDWEQIRVLNGRPMSPELLASLDQLDMANMDALVGFGIDVNDRREMHAVAVGMCLVDTAAGWSWLPDEVKDDLAFISGACLRSLLPMIEDGRR